VLNPLSLPEHELLHDLVGLLRRPELATHVQRTALHGLLLREGRSSAMRLAARLGVRVSWQDSEWDLVRALPDQEVLTVLLGTLVCDRLSKGVLDGPDLTPSELVLAEQLARLPWRPEGIPTVAQHLHRHDALVDTALGLLPPPPEEVPCG